MVATLTPKPKRKAETLTRAPPTIASSRVEDAALRKWPNPWYRFASCILAAIVYLVVVVYLQQIKKKAKAEGKNCHAKTCLSLL
jgi:polyferredoxin